VLLARSAGSGRDVLGNKNGASSEGGSRTKSEQSEGAGAVTGRAAGAVHRRTVFCCDWCTEKKNLFLMALSIRKYCTCPKDISSFLLKGLLFASLVVKVCLC